MDDKKNQVIYECKKCHKKYIIMEYRKDIYCPYCLCDQFDIKDCSNINDIKYIVPFKITKDEAKKILINSYKKTHFLPEIYRNKNLIDRIIGIYIPVGLYDLDIDFSLNLKGEMKKDKELKEYSIDRIGVSTYKNLIIKEGIDDSDIELFDYSYKNMKEYDDSYLKGYMANITNLKYDNPSQIVDDNIIDDTVEQIKNDIKNYNNLELISKDLNISKVDLKKCYVPIWILSYKIDNNIYTSFINGQNGKIKLNYSYDKIKILLLLLFQFIILLLVTIILFVSEVI